jgi:hypothetical protein
VQGHWTDCVRGTLRRLLYGLAGCDSGHCRSRTTVSLIRWAASITSGSVVKALKLKRIAECSTSSGTPIACNTGDGSREPLEQAEPVEQAIPARSRFIKSESALQPGKDTFSVCGR